MKTSAADSASRSKRIGAGCLFATMATMLGSWSYSNLERQIWRRGSPNSSPTSPQSLTHALRYYRRGGQPSTTSFRHIREVCVRRAGRVNAPKAIQILEFWRRNPFGHLLCDPSLGMDEIYGLLQLLPDGPARCLVFGEHRTEWDGKTTPHYMLDTYDTINGLAGLRNHEALLALIGKMRLKQKLGQFELDFAFELALWRMLPDAIASSPQLAFVQAELLTAVEQFLDCPEREHVRAYAFCWANWYGPNSVLLRTKLKDADFAARLRGINLPPLEVVAGKSQRRRRKNIVSSRSTNLREHHRNAALRPSSEQGARGTETN